jgi:hypothetical protein
MSDVQPTQGRITFKEDGDANHYSMLTEDGRWWLAILANGEQTSARQVTNFRRLAACWNACDGIDTDMLEGFSPRFLATYPDRVLSERRALEAQRDHFEALAKDNGQTIIKTACELADVKAQRDELLDTLKDLQGRLLRCAATGASASEAFDSFYQEVVDSAIANAELNGGASRPT